MVQTQTVVPESTSAPLRSHQGSAEAPVRQVPVAGQQPLVDVAAGGRQSVSRFGSDSLASAGSQPDRAAQGIHAGTARNARHRNGALQPDPPRVPAIEGLHGFLASALGEHARGRLGSASGRLFLGRVRDSRVGARLFGGPWRLVGRPHQECERPRASRWLPSDCSMTRGTSSNDWMRTATRSRSISTRGSKTCRSSRHSTRKGNPLTVSVDTRSGPLLGPRLVDECRTRQTLSAGL